MNFNDAISSEKKIEKNAYNFSFTSINKKVSQEYSHPFYIWAKETLGVLAAPKWNFHQYLINRERKLIEHFHSTRSPQSGLFRKAIEKALAEHYEIVHP